MNQQIVFDNNLQSLKSVAWWLYVFHGASLVFSLGLLSWIPLFINYIKRPESEGTFVKSHHSWQIRSFWWYFFGMIIGGIFFITVIGIPLAWLIWGGSWLWKAYRIVRGFVDLNGNKPMPV